jgi:phage terminase small subunit
MTPKQARFVDEYLIDLNATQAAIRAGYSAKTAYSQGQRLLKDVEVAAAIEAAQEARIERVEITQDWVLSRLASVAERCLQAEPVYDRKGDRVMVETPDGEEAPAFTFNATGANGALGLLGKHLGMFKERVEHTGADGGVIQTHAEVDVSGLTLDQLRALAAIPVR